MKKSYFGVRTTPRTLVNRTLTTSAQQKFRNPFNGDADRVYQSLGDKILFASESGESLGMEVSPVYNGNDSDDIDVMTDFHHDIFDIAEKYGKMVDTPSSPSNKDVDVEMID